MRHIAAASALLLLAACGARTDSALQSVQEPPYETLSQSYADAIAEGMLRARIDRLRRAARRMVLPGEERPPG